MRRKLKEVTVGVREGRGKYRQTVKQKRRKGESEETEEEDEKEVGLMYANESSADERVF